MPLEVLSDLTAEFGHSYNYWYRLETQCQGGKFWDTFWTTELGIWGALRVDHFLALAFDIQYFTLKCYFW